eukprot:scaffold128126_cov126-Cyclotella_meneghiniana.AAC.1
MEIACNYSESEAPRMKPKAHDPVSSSDLLSLMLPNVKGNNDTDPQVMIPTEDLVAHSREPEFISLRPSKNQANWGHEYITKMKALLRKDLFQSAVKLEAAKEMGFLEAWTKMSAKFAPGNNSWMDHRKPDGWVVIKEGLQGREFRDDVEDFMMDTSKNSIRMNCNRTTIYYVNNQFPVLRSAKTLISSLNCVSKLRSDAKTDSATPRSIDLIKEMVSKICDSLTVGHMSVVPDLSQESWPTITNKTLSDI